MKEWSTFADGQDDRELEAADREIRAMEEKLDRLEAENERLREELADIKTALNDAPGLRFLSEQCGISFQLPGRMDGAMSEDCKILFRRKYQTLAKLIAEFTEDK